MSSLLSSDQPDRSTPKTNTKWTIVLLGLVIILLLLSAMEKQLPTLKKIGNFFQNRFEQSTSTPPIQTIKIISEESQVIDVVKKSSGAVVSIIASSQVPKMESCIKSSPVPNGLPPEFQQFFNFNIPSLCQNGTIQKQIGAASGFLVSADGYIITNRHVVSNEKAEYTAVLNDKAHRGQKLKATVLARDPENDVAILKVDGQDLPFLDFGDSNNLQIGQTAIAIGYALGQFDNTVTKGVVSGLSRSIKANDGAYSSEQLRGLIQTDAAINPGNSGGPLLDIQGMVIGMNTAMADAQSIGFAIPINYVKAIYKQVHDTGKITALEKAFLGVRFQPITAELKEANHLSFDYGMLLVRGQNQNELAVMPGSPADKAGLQENDIILEVAGKQLNEEYMLSDVIDEHQPGDVLDFKVYHRGETKNIKIKLEKK